LGLGCRLLQALVQAGLQAFQFLIQLVETEALLLHLAGQISQFGLELRQPQLEPSGLGPSDLPRAGSGSLGGGPLGGGLRRSALEYMPLKGVELALQALDFLHQTLEVRILGLARGHGDAGPHHDGQDQRCKTG
jgi:hypothetical protein